MSVLIRGMEMPKNCAECPVNLTACKRGYEYLLAHPELYDQRAEDCPISYVPPHGRLIDVDALIGKLHDECLFDYDARSVVYADIQDAPTIIPEEEGEA